MKNTYKKIKKTVATSMILVGMLQLSVSAIEPYSEDFSSSSGIRKWEKNQKFPSTAVSWHRDGYMVMDVQDSTEGNESIGRDLSGSLNVGESIKVSVRFANVHNNYYKGCVQLWNSKDDILLAESDPFIVYGANSEKYKPVDVELNYTATDDHTEGTVQLRIVEKCNGAQRDITVGRILIKVSHEILSCVSDLFMSNEDDGFMMNFYSRLFPKFHGGDERLLL